MKQNKKIIDPSWYMNKIILGDKGRNMYIVNLENLHRVVWTQKQNIKGLV